MLVILISFMHKARLLWNTVSQPASNQANEVLKNATIAVALKYLSNFRKSLKMTMINYKVELKLQWIIYCVLTANTNDSTDAHFFIYYFIMFFIDSWLELIHFVIIASMYITMVNSVSHWMWEANWRQFNCNDIYIYTYILYTLYVYYIFIYIYGFNFLNKSYLRQMDFE